MTLPAKKSISKSVGQDNEFKESAKKGRQMEYYGSACYLNDNVYLRFFLTRRG